MKSKNEPKLFAKHQGKSDNLIVALYVDDLIFTSSNGKMVEGFKEEMMKKYEMNIWGYFTIFFGIEIYQRDDGFFICQKKYAEKILKKFNLFGCNPADTPLVVNEKLKKDDGGKVDASNCRGIIGTLLYLIATRPDIMYAASLLSRFMNNPSHLHLGATRRVLRYIQGTLDFGIKYDSEMKSKPVGFCDSDWAGCMDDMKSTFGYVF